MEIRVRNVNEALSAGLNELSLHGIYEDSRNGPVLRYPEPVMTQYACPVERVLFNPLRDANPFFHLMEALWMLAGRNDVEFVAHYAERMREFSDDGEVLNGAYGHRWRYYFGWDQIRAAVDELKANPRSRRVVMSMWDPASFGDFRKAGEGSKDIPCNTHIYFMMRGDCLDMTVCCRSNDVVWGAYGANAVHMSMLHELVSALVGAKQGYYYQMSNNFHVYSERGDVKKLLASTHSLTTDVYASESIEIVPLVNEPRTALDEIKRFVHFPTNPYTYGNRFLNRVAQPMAIAHMLHKAKETPLAMKQLDIKIDWHLAAYQWLDRRRANMPKTEETR